LEFCTGADERPEINKRDEQVAASRQGNAATNIADNMQTLTNDGQARQSEKSCEFHLLCWIAAKLSEIEAQLHSPLTARRLHWRYCAKCGERATNANVGGYEGRSALTGRLYCELCVDEREGLR
jgi:hypothetical protein